MRLSFPHGCATFRSPGKPGALPIVWSRIRRIGFKTTECLWGALLAALSGGAVLAEPTDARAAADSHWAWSDLRPPGIPAVPDELRARVRTPVDHFVLAKLAARGVAPAPPAEPAVLLRRVYLDLIGLPPTPAEQRAFLADPSEAAYARVVDDLLSRPQYGERWGRHWLDVVRYAESKGYERDEYKCARAFPASDPGPTTDSERSTRTCPASSSRERGPLLRSAELERRVHALRAAGGRSSRVRAIPFPISGRRTDARGNRSVNNSISSPGGNHSNWDTHGKNDERHRSLCGQTDKPIAGLLADLKARGLLDETLIVWAGEFGRTPVGTNGRDHHAAAFTTWMAGGGIQGGTVQGETDEFGFHVAAGPAHVHDLHATILHLMGLNHEELTYFHSGRDHRLTDVYGKVLQDIVA